MKVAEPSAFAKALAEYQILPDFLLLPSAYFLPWLEVALGAALLLGLKCRLAATICGFLSGVFALAITSALIRGLEVDCGCFSGGAAADISHILLNLVMLGCACFLVDKGAGAFSLDQRWGQHSNAPVSEHRSPLALPIFGLIALIVGGLMGSRQPYWADRLFRPMSSDRILFEPSQIDLGSLWQGELVERTAIYRNISPRTVVITRAGSSCNCTTPELTTRTLLPGQTGELSVGFKAGNRPGLARSKVRLHLEDQGRPAVLELTGEVKTAAEVQPDVLTLAPGGYGEVEVLLHRPYSEKPEVTVVTQSPPVEVEVLSTGEKNKYRLQVRLAEHDDSEVGRQTIWQVQVQLSSNPESPLRFYVKKA